MYRNAGKSEVRRFKGPVAPEVTLKRVTFFHVIHILSSKQVVKILSVIIT